MLEKDKKLRIYSQFTLKEIFTSHKLNEIENNCGEDECGGDGLNLKNKL